MAFRLPALPPRGHPLARATVFALRLAGRTRAGERIGTAWYRRRARLFAEDLMAVRGMESVYLAGSTQAAAAGPVARVSTARRVALGYSDIDLLLVAHLPTLDDELRFRRELVEIVRRHNRPLELFHHIDYFEPRDVELLQRFGHSFVLAQSNWHLLAGRDHRPADARPSARHRELANAAENMKHWMKHAHLLLRAPEEMVEFRRLRHARRMLGGFIAGWLDVDRNLPLASLLEAARPLAPGDAVRALAADPSEFDREPLSRPARDLMAAGLEVLDDHMARVTEDYRDAWPSVLSPAPKLADSDVGPLGTAFISSSFASFEVVSRAPGAGEHVALVTTVPSTPAERAVVEFERALDRAGSLPRATFGDGAFPALLTASMRRAAAFIEPFPLTGVSLAAGAAWSNPNGVGAPPAPPPDELVNLARLWLVQLLTRVRGRMLRFRRHPALARSKMARDVLRLAPMCAALFEGRPVDFGANPIATENIDETALLAEIRLFFENLRPWLGETRANGSHGTPARHSP